LVGSWSLLVVLCVVTVTAVLLLYVGCVVVFSRCCWWRTLRREPRLERRADGAEQRAGRYRGLQWFYGDVNSALFTLVSQ
jgi:hypothetical protein